MKPGLGTQLRHLIELLDNDVALAYQDAGLAYRPRYTPVMRVLQTNASATIGQIAEAAGISQPAATQTVGLMKKDGLVEIVPGADGRQRLVALSTHGKALLPELQRCWSATKAAADGLDAQLDFPLSDVLAQAIAALQTQSFRTRIAEARGKQSAPSNPKKRKTS
ncbi:MAG TPA: MarR family transcriptional regulator [Burkholderiaceae bacterium]